MHVCNLIHCLNLPFPYLLHHGQRMMGKTDILHRKSFIQSEILGKFLVMTSAMPCNIHKKKNHFEVKVLKLTSYKPGLYVLKYLGRDERKRLEGSI